MKIKKKNLLRLIENFLFEQEEVEQEAEELDSFGFDISVMNNNELNLSVDYKKDEDQLSINFETPESDLNSAKTFSLKAGMLDEKELDEIKAYLNLLLIYLPSNKTEKISKVFMLMLEKLNFSGNIEDIQTISDRYVKEVSDNADSRTTWLNQNIFTEEHETSVLLLQDIINKINEYMKNVGVSQK